ncbi:sit4-associated protein [Grosmannia clavigera kw1407]|uniref:Sit4-associated protein n=1 Tax=Grosmannia clavigera (strain kw1407 / UAMH 11150) TaxID=655863 RepID=F0XV58_GROCL|nr:sit4-associated protein [Grosmannia clavigera kw1407]EFW98932.1 sit4-associated protein [Grosmannia clavigera kw1407]
MFWKFGGYASISPIDSILDRPQFALEDLLDENDLLGDIKARNGKLLDYLRKREVLERLLEFVVAPKAEPAAVPIGDDTKDDSAGASDDASNERGRPRLLPFNRPRASSSLTDGGRDDDEAETKRNRYAYVSCEILSCDNWSICETVMDPSNRDLLHKFWQYIKQPALLDPLQASYFTKVNESLFDKKVDDMVVFLKSMDGAVQDMLRHVDCPMIMDLLLKIITLDRPEGSPGIVEWLYTQDVMPTLLSFLSPKNSWATQTSAGDFIKAIITVSANATQNEQTCIGPNELTRQLVSHPCIDELINYMLGGGNALTVGVGIIIEVIRKNNSDYDPDVGTEANSIPSSRDPIYLGTLLRMFAENVPNFMQLMNNAPAQKTRLNSTFNVKIEPLGFDRFKTCELMAELLHCSNMGLLNEFGSETVIAVRDAERKRLRSEGKLAPNRGEDAIAPGTDLLTMRVPHAPAAEEGRRLEIMNVSASDEDGFEEVTHTADMGENEKQQYNVLPLTGPRPSTSSLFEKDDDDFVDEPLSSPRLNTRDDKLPELELPHFDEPDLVVAPLSPTKKKVLSQFSDPEVSKDSESSSTPSTVDNESIDDATVSSDDFVTEATEPALGKGAKTMSDADKGDESDAGIVFTPTISSLSESFHSTAQRSSSPISELREQLAKTIISEEGIVLEQAEEVVAKETLQEDNQAPTAPLNELMPYSTEPAHEASKNAGESKANAVSTTDATEKRAAEENERDAGNESIVVAPRPVEASSKLSTVNATADEPVVGDLLKIQFVEHRVVPTILSFFFSYPWNNFLHNVVYDVVQQVFNGPMDRGFNPNLAISLFESADVTTQIINGQLASEKSQVSTRTRMGYMGHLTLIAEEVVKFTERHPPELLSEVVLEKVMSQDWINYVEGPLAETRERDNAILGGVRPDVSMGNQAGTAGLAAVGLSGLGSSFGMGNTQNTSSALADAGLNGSLDFQGEADGGLGPFSISAGISTGNFVHTGDDCKDDEEGQVNIDVDIIFGGAYGSDGDVS